MPDGLTPRRRGRPKGLPKTGGRKPGTPNKVKGKRQLVAEAHAAGLETPLDYMLRVMRDKRTPDARRDFMAKAAAPYMHPALKAVDFTGHLTHGISRELADFIAGNKAAARSFIRFDDEDQDAEEEADAGALPDH